MGAQKLLSCWCTHRHTREGTTVHTEMCTYVFPKPPQIQMQTMGHAPISLAVSQSKHLFDVQQVGHDTQYTPVSPNGPCHHHMHTHLGAHPLSLFLSPAMLHLLRLLHKHLKPTQTHLACQGMGWGELAELPAHQDSHLCSRAGSFGPFNLGTAPCLLFFIPVAF